METCGKDFPINSGRIFLIHAFRVDERTFEGRWETAHHFTVMKRNRFISAGGMRKCYAAEIFGFPEEFLNRASDEWVLKDYLENVNGDRYDLCRKDVQTQAVAQTLGEIFSKKVKGIEGFGAFPRILPSFLVQQVGPPNYFTIEPKIDSSSYVKHINNDGLPVPPSLRSQLGQKCLAFSHWSLKFTGGRFLVCDVQGSEDALTDIQIASVDKERELFGAGNLGEGAFTQFKRSHECNPYCTLLGLESLKIASKQGSGDEYGKCGRFRKKEKLA